MKKEMIFIAIVFASLVSCEYEDITPKTCGVSATVRDLTGFDGCGFVFELEDGTRLEPLRIIECGTPPLPKEVTDDPLYNFEFVNGKQVYIDYQIAEGYFSACMVGPTVKITCISDVHSLEE